MAPKTKNANQPNEKLPDKLKAVSDPTRLKILLMLEGKPRTVNEIVNFFDLAQPTISRHLQTLSAAGLVKRTRKGQCVYYEVEQKSVGVMCIELANCFPCCCDSVIIKPMAIAGCCEEKPAKPKKKARKKTTSNTTKRKPGKKKGVSR